jgi:TetR/AcrR family acrAB operon transcriptional repressor
MAWVVAGNTIAMKGIKNASAQCNSVSIHTSVYVCFGSKPMARRTKEDALATRNLILDTAEGVFQRRGVSRTSLHEIAQEAGLTRGAIYWHFQNKAELFDAMMLRVTLPLESSLDCGGSGGTRIPLDFLRRGVAQALRQTVGDPQVRRVFEIASHKTEYVDELEVIRDRRIALREGCLGDLERLFAGAMELGQIGRRIPASVAARGAHALIDGLLQNWLLDPTAYDLEAVGLAALDTYLAGLTATPSAALATKASRRH